MKKIPLLQESARINIKFDSDSDDPDYTKDLQSDFFNIFSDIEKELKVTVVKVKVEKEKISVKSINGNVDTDDDYSITINLSNGDTIDWTQAFRKGVSVVINGVKITNDIANLGMISLQDVSIVYFDYINYLNEKKLEDVL